MCDATRRATLVVRAGVLDSDFDADGDVGDVVVVPIRNVRLDSAWGLFRCGADIPDVVTTLGFTVVHPDAVALQIIKDVVSVVSDDEPRGGGEK